MWVLNMTTPNNKPQQAETLRQMIHTHFAGVSRQGGISLHQTEVVDAYGLAEEMLSALAQDTDTQWTEVQDSWIEQFGGVGGRLAGIDAKAQFRKPFIYSTHNRLISPQPRKTYCQ